MILLYLFIVCNTITTGFIFRPREVSPMFYVIPENIPDNILSPLLTADTSDTDFRGEESDEEMNEADTTVKGSFLTPPSFSFSISLFPDIYILYIVLYSIVYVVEFH